MQPDDLRRRSARRGDRRKSERVRLARRAARRGRGGRRARLHSQCAPRGADAAGTRARRARRLREAARDERRGEREHAAGARGKRPRGRRRLPRAGLPARRTHARCRRGGRPGGVARRARSLRLRRRAPGHGRLAPRTAELGPDLRDGRPRRALVRSRRARHQRPDRGSARRFPDVRAGQGARRPRNAATPVRQRRHRQRHLQRTGRRTQEPAAVRARGEPRRLHLGPGVAERAAAPPRRDADRGRRQGSRDERRPRAGVRAVPGRPRRRLRRRLSRDPARRVPRDGRAKRTVRSRPSSTVTAACRSSPRRSAARATAAGFRSTPSPRAGARDEAPAARSRAARTPTPSGKATRRAAAPRERSPRA